MHRYIEVLIDMDTTPALPELPSYRTEIKTVLIEAVIFTFGVVSVVGNVILWPVAFGWVQ